MTARQGGEDRLGDRIGAALGIGVAAFYRDVLGWDESWREGTSTVGFALPGSPVELMLDLASDEAGTPSAFFEVDDIDAFYAQHRDRIDFLAPPATAPPVRWAAFRDPSGNLVRLYQVVEDQPDDQDAAASA